MSKGKGNNRKQDFIPANGRAAPQQAEVETLSEVDKGKDFVKAGETA
jgi:hypothetical protein